MTTIYHNPRCSKSRQGLAIVENSEIPFKIVNYLNDTLTTKEIKSILTQLNMAPLDLVRKGEAIWKKLFKGKELTEIEIIQAMADYPKLIERPIVVHGDKAVLGRPPENIEVLLKN